MNDLDLARILRRTRRTLRIALAWALLGVLAAFFHWVLTRELPGSLPLERLIDLHVWRSLAWGIIGGGLYIFLLRDRLRKLSFLPAFGIMTVLTVIATIVVHRLFPLPLETGTSPDAAHWSPIIWAEAIHRSVLFGCTMLAVRWYDQNGGSAGLIGGRSKPRQELRIFMFLDMRSSTAIAEQLGDTRYFQLLNDVYTDITDPVVDSQGDIYQYVGDEISVSWPLHKGIRGARCLRCFFAIQDRLQRRSAYYVKRYGAAPVFKAGFHCGQVTTGEVGIVKKQRLFSGDVVNTAAHIQAQCNQYGVDNLVSKDLLDVLSLPADRWKVDRIGEIPLKGKRHMVELATISRIGRKA